MDTFFQRRISQMAVKNGGTMTVSSNTEPLGHLKTASGASLLVTSGGVVRDITNSGGTAVIAAGGTAYIDSGFVAEGLIAIQQASYGGAGGIVVRQGGTIKNCTIDSNGVIYVSSAAAESCIISSGHLQLVGGSASGISQYSGHFNLYKSDCQVEDSYISGGNLTVLSGGGKISNTQFTAPAQLRCYGGGVQLASCTFNQSGTYVGIKAGDTGVISSCTVISGAIAYISSGSILDCTLIDAGLMVVRSAGYVSNLTVSHGNFVISGGVFAESGYVQGSGTGLGYYSLQSGASVNSITAGPQGKIYIQDHASATECIASGSGAAIAIVSSTGIGSLIKDCTGIDSGCLYVRGNGIAGSNIVVSGNLNTRLTVYQPAAGEIVSAVNCSAVGGRMNVSSGGQLHSGYVAAGGQCVVFVGGVVYSCQVSDSGALIVSQGGTASTVFLNSGGTLTVSAGGTATDVVSSTGGIVNSQAGAVINYRGE